MFFTKLKNFIVQCLLLPISLLINVCVIAPFAYLIPLIIAEDYAGIPFGLIGTAIMIPIAIGLSKLLVRIKGNQTDENWVSLGVFRDEVTTQFTYDGEVLAESTYTSGPYVAPVHNHALTGWGFFAIITSVIAFPLRLIAVIIAFTGLFISEIYTSHRPLPDDPRIGTVNKILHSLFDFVILPSKTERGDSSPFAFIFLGVDILVTAITFFINMLTSSSAGDPGIWTMFLSFIILLPAVILIIKNIISLYRNYDMKRGIINSVKLLCITLIPTFIAVILLIFVN